MSKHRLGEKEEEKWEEKLLILLPLACNFHPLSTPLKELSKTHQRHLSRLNEPQRITSRLGTVLLELERKDGNDNSALLLIATAFSFYCWLNRGKSHFKHWLPLAKKNIAH